MLKINELITARAKEPIKALQNPQRNLKPGTRKAAIPKTIALIMTENKPKVKKVIGKVKKAKIGRNKALTIPKTIAEIIALPKVSISTPVGNLEIINRLIAVTNSVIKSPMILFIEVTPDSVFSLTLCS
jgi:hypothetical protein